MLSISSLGVVSWLLTLTYASPIGSAEDKRNILVPAYLVQTTNVDPATWSTSPWTGTPKFMPTSIVDITEKSPDKRAPRVNRNILVLDHLIPTTTVDRAAWPTGEWTGTPRMLPTSPVGIATTAAREKREVTSMPDLVPSTTVDLATDSTGTWTGTPKFMPTTVVKLGTTSGCQVSLSMYSTKSGSITEATYVTSCSDGVTPTADSDAALATEVSACCGGEYDLHACGNDGSMPTGTVRWRCTFDAYTYAGVSASATTSWA